mgnify:CR=1 FL=1
MWQVTPTRGGFATGGAPCDLCLTVSFGRVNVRYALGTTGITKLHRMEDSTDGPPNTTAGHDENDRLVAASCARDLNSQRH